MKKNKLLTKEDSVNLLFISFVYGINVCVTVFWQVLEILIYKEIQYRVVDDIISLILTISLSINLKYLIENYLKED